MFENIKFTNPFSKLPSNFYTKQSWSSFDQPFLLHFNHDLAKSLGIQDDPEELMQIFNGSKNFIKSSPLAMVYGGHQFGNWVNQLGDGRGILFGQIDSSEGLVYLHIKGAGKTPYSRFGDGRAVIRSSVREHLCGEAMFGLGIPSSRSLMLFGSNEPVMREETERGAMIVRTAKTHIRFGHFEYFHHNKIADGVKTLLDHVIDCYYPDTKQDSDKYLLFFDATVKKTAHMVSAWQSVGFNHGVMNTDNMSILGETFDYGPYAFMETYNPNYICNHTDSQGRYSFSNQPSIAEWNCYALASALIDLFSELELRDILSKFNDYFYDSLIEKYRKKLGFKSAQDSDYDLLLGLFEIMEIEKLDYTNTFRELSKFISSPDNLKLSEKFSIWLASYKDRLSKDENNIEESRILMDENNPKYILRNYLAQSAIEDAEQGKAEKIDELAVVLSNPYVDLGKSMEKFCQPAPKEQQNQQLSCSS